MRDIHGFRVICVSFSQGIYCEYMQARSYASLYQSTEIRERARVASIYESKRLKGALESTATTTAASESSGFQRMAMCRKALEALDRRGWERSYHQRYFHDHFIRACARVFWKVSSNHTKSHSQSPNTTFQVVSQHMP